MLNILEYSSARARMSVVARGPDGSIHVFTKGADAQVGTAVPCRTYSSTSPGRCTPRADIRQRAHTGTCMDSSLVPQRTSERQCCGTLR